MKNKTNKPVKVTRKKVTPPATRTEDKLLFVLLALLIVSFGFWIGYKSGNRDMTDSQDVLRLHYYYNDMHYIVWHNQAGCGSVNYTLDSLRKVQLLESSTLYFDTIPTR